MLTTAKIPQCPTEAGSLMRETFRLLHSRHPSITLGHVARGAELRHNWVVAFSSGKVPDPGVNRVQKLYEYLTGAALDVKANG